MSESTIPYIHQRLVEKAKQNDKAAQGELYSLYCKAILNSCFRVVRDAYVAEDIMQDAFIEAFKNIKQHQESSTFGAWLKKIAINRSINYLKRDQLISEKLEQQPELTNDNHETEAEFEFTVEEIKSSLATLPTNYRLVFSLYLIEGYDHEEIAEIMNISPSTSRSQLSRAKKQLKSRLELQKKSLI